MPLRIGVMPVEFEYFSMIVVDESLVEWQISCIKPSRRESLRSILNNKRFGIIYHSKASDTAIVAIRGTYNITDIIRDFEFEVEPYKCILDYGNVHRGFQHIYFAVRDSIIEGIKSIPDIKRCILTGHSMGGALCVLAAPDLHNQHILSGPPEVVTFAAPRAGLKDFVDKFNVDIPDCTQIINKWDFVTRIPPLFHGFDHTGQLIKIDGGTTLDSYRAHSLEESYIPGLNDLVKLAGK